MRVSWRDGLSRQTCDDQRRPVHDHRQSRRRTTYTDAGVANCSTYYYVVSATNSLGREHELPIEQTATLGAYALAVNSGGSAVGQFVADANVTGRHDRRGTTAAIDTDGLVAPAPQSVYQAERYGNITYTFQWLDRWSDLQSAVALCRNLLDSGRAAALQRHHQWHPVLTNFDIIAAAGAAEQSCDQ
jgi:hypothetical protein